MQGMRRRKDGPQNFWSFLVKAMGALVGMTVVTGLAVQPVTVVFLGFSFLFVFLVVIAILMRALEL